MRACACCRGSPATPRRSTRKAFPPVSLSTRITPARRPGKAVPCRRCCCRGITTRFAAGVWPRRNARRASDAPIYGPNISPASKAASRKSEKCHEPHGNHRPRRSRETDEGERERIQAFEGVCIARKNAGTNSSFTLRKISYGEGVERIFPLYSPRITAIEVVRQGAVRRTKLYYLRGLTGKKARIAEKARD